MASSAARKATEPAEPPAVMTLGEVADLLRVSEPTVRKLARDGKLRALRVGVQWRFHRPDVERYLAQG